MSIQETKNKAKKRLEDNLKPWLATFYGIQLSFDDTKSTIILSDGQNSFETTPLDENDFDEIATSHLQHSNNDGFKNILTQKKDNFYALVQANDKIELEDCKIKFFLNKSKTKIINLRLSNTLNFSLLFYFVNLGKKIHIDDSKLQANFSSNIDLLSLFKILYLEIEFEKVNEKERENWLPSAIYEACNFFNGIIVPFVNSPINLGDFGGEIISKNENSNFKYQINLNKYDNLPIFYFFSYFDQPDLRFQFFDLYHVLEYYFDKEVINFIVEILKVEVKDINMLYKEDYQYTVAQKIKDSITINAKDYKERDNLEKLISNYTQSTNFSHFTQSYKLLNHISTNIPELNLQLGNKLVSDLTKRIYGLRNSITHSKGEEFKIHPHMGNEDLILNDVYLLKDIAKYLIKKYSKCIS